MHIGASEIILIVAALFLLFGANRLPQLVKSFGQTRKAFKDAMSETVAEARIERKPKQIKRIISPAPRISNISDEELLNEMSRRAEMRQI